MCIYFERVCVCVCMCTSMYVGTHMPWSGCGGQGKLVGVGGLFFYHIGPGDGIQV